MNNIFKNLTVVCIIFMMMAVSSLYSQTNDSWKQFKGPDRSGIANEDLGTLDWTVGPQLLWKKEIGSGFSELLVSNGFIYTMVSTKVDSLSGWEYIVAYDEATGDEVWKSQVDSLFIDVDGWGDGPRSTPVIDDEKIYSLSAMGKLSANSIKDGSLKWQIDITKEFGAVMPRWGFSSSPLLVDNKLVLEVGGKDSKAFMAFNPKSGKVIWESSDGNASYNSPILATIDDQEQIIFANGNQLFSLDNMGDTLWTYYMPFRNVNALPVFIPPNKIFMSGVRSPAFFIVEIKDNKAKEVISGSTMKNDYSSCMYHNGYIYGYHVAAVRCISAETGEIKWTKRGFGKGSLSLVDDILLILSDQGRLAFVKAQAEAYEELATVKALEGKSWTAPSVANAKVYVRNLTQMACYKLK